MHRLRRILAIIMASVAAVSCASAKVPLAGQPFQTLLLQGEGFAHVAYFKPGIGSNKTLHVYLEHDGIALGVAVATSLLALCHTSKSRQRTHGQQCGTKSLRTSADRSYAWVSNLEARRRRTTRSTTTASAVTK